MIHDIIKLLKLRISLLVIITSYLGYYLGLRSIHKNMMSIDSWIILLFLLIGVFFTSSGASILNQFIEIDSDAKMNRTKSRPLPKGTISPYNAMYLGLISSLLGSFILFYFVNSSTSILAMSTILIYVFIYTPIKRISVYNTFIGSIPGALPIVGGWVAATNNFDTPAWILFGILFCWQIPHFLSIAIIYSSDYARGGMKMYPTVYPESKKTSYLILFFTIALIVTTIGLYIIKLAGMYYAIGSAMIGIVFLFFSTLTMIDNTKNNARKLMIASILYLPALLVIIILDKYFN